MLLGFKTHVNGKPTYFKEKILAPFSGEQDAFQPKIHSIREGWRWVEGKRIHMATGVRTKNYCQFNKGIPELEKCTGTQDIWIKPYSPGGNKIFRESKVLVWSTTPDNSFHFRKGQPEWKSLGQEKMELLAQNDGFDSLEDFFQWFPTNFKGQIVHWTDFRY